jgi:hypothetical protein
MFLKQPILSFPMEDTQEERTAKFIAHMKSEFAQIPKNLSEEEYLDRAERCLSLSETFARQEEKMKAKKYQLLAQKYKQLAKEKHPGYKKPEEIPTTNAQLILDETPVENPVEKKSLWKRFLGIFSGKEVKVEVEQSGSAK